MTKFNNKLPKSYKSELEKKVTTSLRKIFKYLSETFHYKIAI